MIGSILPLPEEDYRFFQALTKSMNKVREGGRREGGKSIQGAARNH